MNNLKRPRKPSDHTLLTFARIGTDPYWGRGAYIVSGLASYKDVYYLTHDGRWTFGIKEGNVNWWPTKQDAGKALDEFRREDEVRRKQERLSEHMEATDRGQWIKFTLKNSAKAPTRAHDTDAGFDLCACKSRVLRPGVPTMINTGVSIAMPDGFMAQVLGRSGLAMKSHVVCLHVGTIDAGYRGEIKVLLGNLGSKPYVINVGDRIAQLVFHRLPAVEMQMVYSLEDETSERGTNGLGSTGK